LRQGIRPAAACRVVYEDEWLIAVEKPAGLVCAHAPAGQASVVSWLRESLRTGRAEAGLSHSMVPGPFVGVVSRLDQPVSGIVVFAKTSAAAASLAEQFRTRSVSKTYLAMVEGRFPGRAGEWQEWTDRLPRLPQPAPGFARRGGSAGRREPPTDALGQIATTAVRLLDRSGEVSVVELRPTTGRKHQLRRQLALRRCPIVGDRRYGSRIPLGDAAIALHASALGFHHPQDGRPVLVQSRPPALWLERFPAIRLGPA
jgi:23S rRNA pseudouridine1911/1915/1917 synthase